MLPPSLSLSQAMAGQSRLRGALGLPEERFDLPAFVGMISDEIEQMRAAGTPDAETARLVSEATGCAIGADDLQRHYAPPEARRRG